MKEVLLKDFRPECLLKAAEHVPQRARFPVIDAHNHLFGDLPADKLVEVMDAVGAHFGWPDDTAPFSFRESLRREADRWRAKDALLAWDKQPRDPRPGQWQALQSPPR